MRWIAEGDMCAACHWNEPYRYMEGALDSSTRFRLRADIHDPKGKIRETRGEYLIAACIS